MATSDAFRTWNYEVNNNLADRSLTKGDWMEALDGVRKAAGAITAGLAVFMGLVAIATILSFLSSQPDCNRVTRSSSRLC